MKSFGRIYSNTHLTFVRGPRARLLNHLKTRGAFEKSCTFSSGVGAARKRSMSNEGQRVSCGCTNRSIDQWPGPLDSARESINHQRQREHHEQAGDRYSQALVGAGRDTQGRVFSRAALKEGVVADCPIGWFMSWLSRCGSVCCGFKEFMNCNRCRVCASPKRVHSSY